MWQLSLFFKEVIAAVYLLVRRSNTFVTQYFLLANEVIDASFRAASECFGALRGVGKSITSYAIDSGEAFPFVSVRDWEVRTEEFLRASLDEALIYTPLVNAEDVSTWEAYSVEQARTFNDQHQGRVVPQPIKEIEVNEDEVLGRFRSFLSVLDEMPDEQREYAKEEYARAVDTVTTVRSQVAPVWHLQTGTNASTLINTNILGIPAVQELLVEAAVYRHGVLAPFPPVKSIAVPSKTDESYSSGLIEPVYGSFNKTAPVIGFLAADVPWTSYFQNILPENVGDLMIHIHDTCMNTNITLSANATRVAVHGLGDLHDSRYDEFKVSSNWKSGPGSVAVDNKSLKVDLDAFSTPKIPHHW